MTRQWQQLVLTDDEKCLSISYREDNICCHLFDRISQSLSRQLTLIWEKKRLKKRKKKQRKNGAAGMFWKAKEEKHKWNVCSNSLYNL